MSLQGGLFTTLYNNVLQDTLGIKVALLGPIPISELQSVSITKTANPIAHKSDIGYVLQQVGERNLDTVNMRFLLRGANRYAIKSSLDLAYLRRQKLPFFADVGFMFLSMITQLTVTKTNQKIEVFEVTMVIQEVIQPKIEQAILMSDIIGYGAGILIDKVQDMQTIESPRAESADETGRPMDESDPIAESAIVSPTTTNATGQTFTEVVADG